MRCHGLLFVILMFISIYSSMAGKYKIDVNTTRTFKINKCLGAYAVVTSDYPFNVRMYEGNTLLKNRTNVITFSHGKTRWSYHNYHLEVDYNNIIPSRDYIIVNVRRDCDMIGPMLTYIFIGVIFGSCFLGLLWLYIEIYNKCSSDNNSNSDIEDQAGVQTLTK